jgi:cyanophycin synthetase
MNVTEHLTAMAGSQPDAAAIQAVDGVLSFAELDHIVSATAKSFHDAGISPGDVVAIALSDELAHIIASLGLARLGAGQIVFHGSDTSELRTGLAQRLSIAATITHDASKAVTGAPVIAPPSGTLSELRAMAEVPFAPSDEPDLTLFYQRSSGTTGRSRLGRVTHEMMVARMQPLAHDGPSHKLLSLPHINFEGAKQNLYRYLLSGRCIAFCPHIATSIVETIKFILGKNVDFIAGSPIHATSLLGGYSGATPLFPDLEAFRMSSTLVPDSLRQDIMNRLTPNLYVAYGLTEIGSVAVAPPQSVAERPGIVGWVTDNITVEVVDEQGRPQPNGAPGELRLRSPGMLDGYLGEPEETASRFRDGWFYSGDRGVFADDGALIHLGRADDVIIYDGINIYPSAIENALLENPAVAAAAVFAVDDKSHGAIPVAAVILSGETSRERLIAETREKLGQHAAGDIMIVEEFPRTTAGKVIKQELAAAFFAIQGNA